MSEWTSKYAIMRDLAEAQGFDVPADLEGIGANEKPPALNIPEDTGEDYFGHCEGDGDCGPPDLALIQHMLNMVRDVNISNCEDNPEQVVQISKPSNLNIGKDITHTKTGTIPKTVQKNVQPQVKKVKKKRENVAVNSMLLAMAADTPILNMEPPKEPIKLLKPTDFISESIEPEIVMSVEKVNGWLDTQVTSTSVSVEKVNGWLDTQVPSTSVSRCSGNPLTLDPGSMFRRKTNSTTKSSGTDSIKSSSPQKKSAAAIGSYKPSMLPGDTQQSRSSVPKESSYPLALEPNLMFKRRSGSTVKSPESDSMKSYSPQEQVTSSIGNYKPSMLAGEYYQKYMERSKMKQIVQEDVWTRAERIMKELDTRKIIEAEAATKEAALTEDVSVIDTALDTLTIDEVAVDTNVIDETAVMDSKATIPDMLSFLQNKQSRPSRDTLCRELISLPQHRHLLAGGCGACVVCAVVTAHGYDVDGQIYGNAK